MILVVADDFTGAAELAGIAHRYGMPVAIQTDFNPDTQVDLVTLDTDTRSLSPAEAAAKVTDVAARLRDLKLDWIYKKTDSVLRGHVLLELETLLAGVRKRRALLVPANPSAGRTVSDGRYFIHGRPLHQTDFARDPECPVTTSEVRDLVGHSNDFEIQVLPSSVRSLPEVGIIVGEAQKARDLRRWASRLQKDLLPAGGAEFFEALLQSRGLLHRRSSVSKAFELFSDKTTLCVFGSTSEYSRGVLTGLRSQGIAICALPCRLTDSGEPSSQCLQKWFEESRAAFKHSSLVVVAIAQPAIPSPELAQRLAEATAGLVRLLLGAVDVEELVLEGGATASTVLRGLGWQRFTVGQELAPGVVRAKVMGRTEHVTVKPGSYLWPKGMW